MMLKWPRDVSRHFFVLWLRYFDQNIGTNLVVNMLSDTTADVTGAGDPATVNIYSSRVVSVEQPPPPAPEEYALLQNYPNPFNPETNVGYWIGEGGFVSLKVYDVLGRKVRTLANEVKRPGTYTVRFDGSWLAGGVYFYRLEAGNYVSVKKMLLVR